MTEFQAICVGVFVAVCAFVYRAKLSAVLSGLLSRKAAASAPVVQPSIAVGLVNDIIAVTQLRDRLAAEQCTEGVEACTVLLRVIVEFQQPSKGVV